MSELNESPHECAEGIIAMLIRKGAPPNKAKDIFNDTVLAYYEKLEKDKDFIPEKGVCNYMAGIAKNKLIKPIHPNPQPLPNNLTNENGEHVRIQEEKNKILDECLEQLKTKYPIGYRVISKILDKDLNLNLIDIANEINKSYSNTRKIKQRATDFLRDCYKSKIEI